MPNLNRDELLNPVHGIDFFFHLQVLQIDLRGIFNNPIHLKHFTHKSKQYLLHFRVFYFQLIVFIT